MSLKAMLEEAKKVREAAEKRAHESKKEFDAENMLVEKVLDTPEVSRWQFIQKEQAILRDAVKEEQELEEKYK